MAVQQILSMTEDHLMVQEGLFRVSLGVAPGTPGVACDMPTGGVKNASGYHVGGTLRRTHFLAVIATL
jgi:hypothetical protein